MNTFKIADPDGSVYDAKFVRRIGFFYEYDLNGYKFQVTRADVRRQAWRRMLRCCFRWVLP